MMCALDVAGMMKFQAALCVTNMRRPNRRTGLQVSFGLFSASSGEDEVVNLEEWCGETIHVRDFGGEWRRRERTHGIKAREAQKSSHQSSAGRRLTGTQGPKKKRTRSWRTEQ
jgi:hypothetical protein